MSDVMDASSADMASTHESSHISDPVQVQVPIPPNDSLSSEPQTIPQDSESSGSRPPAVETSASGTTIPLSTPTGPPPRPSEQSLSVVLNGGNVITIPLQQLQPRVTISGSGGSNITVSNRPTSNVQIHVSQLPPLVPQPVTTDNAATPHAHDDEALARFKCTLCYEFMNDPVGCSSDSCSSRFCQKCLVRAARESSRGVPGAVPKCPTCRVEFSSMRRDEVLIKEMLRGPTVACRHEGCPEQQLKLLFVQNHESSCAFEKVKCRYSSFGCPWIGRRGDVIDHEANECALEKVKVLVQGFRKMEKDYATRLSILQQQQMATLQMQQVYQQNAQRDLIKSTSNIFDLLQYCHVITCATNHFLQTKERWHAFFRSNEGHGAVTNFLVLLPTLLASGTLTMLGFQSLFKFLFDERTERQSPTTIAAMAFELLLENCVIGILLGALMSLLLLANLVDSGSSITWGRFPVPGVGTHPVMCDILSVTIFTMQIGILEYYGAAGKAFVVWILLGVSSSFYPAMILTISHDTARGLVSTPDPTLENIQTKARSLEPVLFGLRFCCVGTYFGILPTFDAAIISVLAKGLLQHPRLGGALSMENSFFERLPRSFLLAYLGCKTAIVSADFQNWRSGNLSQIIQEDSIVWSLLETWLAFGALLIATIWLNMGLKIGITLGHEIIRRSESSSARPDGNVPSPDYQLLGLASFGVWVSVLGILIHVR